MVAKRLDEGIRKANHECSTTKKRLEKVRFARMKEVSRSTGEDDAKRASAKSKRSASVVIRLPCRILPTCQSVAEQCCCPDSKMTVKGKGVQD
eukprot:2311087-Pleurochrysis_carterae.AAC.1